MIQFEYYKPQILVSRCLEFAKCRYDGQVIKNQLIYNLKNYVEFHTVCPEADIGMGIPRPTIRIEKFDLDVKLIQPKTGTDFMEKMQNYSREFVSKYAHYDGLILKSKSPSCGIKGIPVYKSGNKTIEKTSGVFAKVAMESYPDAFIEDEGRLNNFNIRENYLSKIFTIAHFNALKTNPSMKSLVDFQSAYKYYFMSIHQDKMRELGRIVANHDKRSIDHVFETYQIALLELLKKQSNKKNTINVLHHILGYFSKFLNASEKTHFLNLVEKYRSNQIPLFVCNQLLISWIFRFKQRYLEIQRFFAPFPAKLMDGAQPKV